MKKYYKLLIVPCVIIIISLYLIGTDVINRMDRVDDPSRKAAEVAHYLYGAEPDESDGKDGAADNQQNPDASNTAEADNNTGYRDNTKASENQEPPELKEGSGKVNINTASKEELTTLDGIGEKYAERIIETREKRGGFTSVEQITEVKGIGQKRFEKIKDEITVGETDKNN